MCTRNKTIRLAKDDGAKFLLPLCCCLNGEKSWYDERQYWYIALSLNPAVVAGNFTIVVDERPQHWIYLCRILRCHKSGDDSYSWYWSCSFVWSPQFRESGIEALYLHTVLVHKFITTGSLLQIFWYNLTAPCVTVSLSVSNKCREFFKTMLHHVDITCMVVWCVLSMCQLVTSYCVVKVLLNKSGQISCLLDVGNVYGLNHMI